MKIERYEHFFKSMGNFYYSVEDLVDVFPFPLDGIFINRRIISFAVCGSVDNFKDTNTGYMKKIKEFISDEEYDIAVKNEKFYSVQVANRYPRFIFAGRLDTMKNFIKTNIKEFPSSAYT